MFYVADLDFAKCLIRLRVPIDQLHSCESGRLRVEAEAILGGNKIPPKKSDRNNPPESTYATLPFTIPCLPLQLHSLDFLIISTHIYIIIYISIMEPLVSKYVPHVLLHLLSLAPSQYCQAYFTILGLGCVGLQLLPSLQDALLNYGARKADAGDSTATGGTAEESLLVTLLRKLGLLTRVPHSWFVHFYVALLCLQAFWAVQFVTHGRILTAIAEREVASGGGRGMTLGQVVLVWGMLSIQGARRLYECLVIMKPSASPMLAVHWVLSFLVYVFMSISIWVEGSGMFPTAAGPMESVIVSRWPLLTFWTCSIDYQCLPGRCRPSPSLPYPISFYLLRRGI